MDPYPALVLAAAAAAVLVLRFMLWRALLVFAPSSVRVEPEDPPGQARMPAPLARVAAQLDALGFAPLGTHSERPPLGPITLCFDFARPADRTFATGWVMRDGAPRLYFLSVLAGGGFVITANYRRPARTVHGQYLSGGLEDVSPERVLKAHLRLLDGRALSGELSLDGRVGAARAWYAGPGRAEVRQQNFPGLLWSVGTLGMVAAAILARR
jgi:hypothetical protein